MGVKKKKKRKKMRPGGGSAKGSKFERDLCTILSYWWTENKRDDIFWRTAGSGSRATSRRRRRGISTANEFGDVKFIDPIGKSLLDAFCFELKNYRTYDVLGVLQAVDQNADWMRFWAQCYAEAMAVPRRPFLITKRNRGLRLGWVLAVTAIEFELLGYSPSPSMVMHIDERVVTVKNHDIHLPKQSVVGFQFDQFLEVVDPRVLEDFYGPESAERGSGENAGNDAAAAAADDGTASESAGGGSTSPSEVDGER